MKINLKELVRRLFWFVNFRTMVRVTMWWMWPRRGRTFFIFEGRQYTYGEVYRQSLRYADFFLAERKKRIAKGLLGPDERLSLGIYMDNTPEFLFASFGAGLSNSVLFAINTGFRGETLGKVIDQARISLLIMNASTEDEIDRVIGDVTVIGREDVLYVGNARDRGTKGFRLLEEVIEASEKNVPLASMAPIDNFSPVIVIYTSGTTGMPKGVPCTHIKLVAQASS